MVEKISKDMVASVHYTGTLPDSGEIFDSSEGRDPLSFLVGHGQMIPGFEEELMGNNMADFFHTRPTEYSKKNQSFDEEDLF